MFKETYIESPIIVLAGGFGTRLRSIVNVPKIIAPINNKTFLYYFLNNLQEQGFKNVILSLHYKSDLIIDQIKEYKFKFKISSIVEDVPLGTGGAIINIIKKLDLKKTFYVINGDTWLSQNMSQMEFYNTPCIGLVRVKNNLRYGSVKTQGLKIINFEEKNNHFQSNWINSGLYKFKYKDFPYMSNIKNLSLEKEIIPFMVKKKNISGIKMKSDFYDIGIPSDYNNFSKYIQKRFKYNNYVKSA